MPLVCEVIVDDDIQFEAVDALCDLLEHAGSAEDVLAGTTWQMTLRLSGDDEISALHAEFFNDPTPTDVITFPSGEPPSEMSYLGDVVVSVETAAAQAGEAAHSAQREVAFLALHGLLHLCGYDDATDDQRALMHQRQYEHLTAWERSRGRPW